MLKRVFPERQHKSANNRGSTGASSQQGDGGGGSQTTTTTKVYQRSDLNIHNLDGNIVTGAASSSSTDSSPVKSSGGLGSRLSSSTSAANSPVKSEVISTHPGGGGGGGGGSDYHSGTTSTGGTNLSKLKTISRSCSSTEFQSLKLESMSTVEDFKSVSKTISSALLLDRDGILVKQLPSTAPASGHDAQESTSMSTPSDEDVDTDPTESLFKQQAKFFCQMKEYLLSQQSSLRQHLELLNATVASRKKKVTSRRQRFVNSGHSVHMPAKQKPETTPDLRGNNNHDLDLMNEFHSCSSTEKSEDDIQVCPLCGVEIEDSENPDALEEHVASHWCSPDDPI